VAKFHCHPGIGEFKQLGGRSRGLLNMLVETVEGGATTIMVSTFLGFSDSPSCLARGCIVAFHFPDLFLWSYVLVCFLEFSRTNS
jgi:hypothetical protein